MEISAQELVENIGPCTKDIRDCEIMRATIVFQKVELNNERSQAIRFELAKVACDNCRDTFLRDIAIS